MSDQKFPTDIEERYLLGRLTDSEKEAYEELLKQDPEASKALENERILISGIRRSGKAALKREIREQARGRAPVQQDWSILWKAAAVFLLAVLVPSLVFFSHQFQQDQASELVTAHKTEAPLADRMESAPEEEIVTIEDDLDGSSSRRDTPTEFQKEREEAKQPLLGEAREAGSRQAAGSGIASSVGDEADGQKKRQNQEVSLPAPSTELAEEVALEGQDKNEDSRLPYQAVQLRNLHKADRDAMLLDTITESDDLVTLNAPLDNQFGRKFSYMDNDAVARRSRSAKTPQWKLKSNTQQSFEAKDQAGKTTARNWTFSSGNGLIEVLMSQYPDQQRDDQKNIPGNFPVTVTKRDSTVLQLHWLAPRHIYSLDPRQITLHLPSGNTLHILLSDSLYYQINLSTDATEAIYQEKQ